MIACKIGHLGPAAMRIDPGSSDHIHDAIDDLERRQQQECNEHDRRSAWRIADRYRRIKGWMNNEARRSHWRGW